MGYREAITGAVLGAAVFAGAEVWDDQTTRDHGQQIETCIGRAVSDSIITVEQVQCMPPEGEAFEGHTAGEALAVANALQHPTTADVWQARVLEGTAGVGIGLLLAGLARYMNRTESNDTSIPQTAVQATETDIPHEKSAFMRWLTLDDGTFDPKHSVDV